MDQVAGLFNVLLSAALLVLAIWLGLYFCLFFYRRLRPGVEITNGAWNRASAADPSVAQDFAKTWRQLLPAGSRQMDRLAFFELPRTPAAALLVDAQERAAIDAVELKVQGLDVGTFLQQVRKLTQIPTYTFEGTLRETPKPATLEVRLCFRGETVKTWVLVGRGTPTETTPGAGQESLLADAVLRIAYDLRSDPALRTWRATMGPEPKLSTAKAFAAYNRGLFHLDKYFESNAPEELALAVTEFRTLTEEEPREATGWTLLGMALAEYRHESEAIDAYDRAFEKLSPGDQKDLKGYQLQLLKASALTKQYATSSANAAIELLAALQTRLKQARDNAATGKRVDSLTRLIAQDHVQRAHTLAHYLAFLRHEDAFALLEGLPATIDLDRRAIKEARDLDAKQRAAAPAQRTPAQAEALRLALRTQMERIHVAYQAAVHEAETEIGSLERSTSSDNQQALVDLRHELLNATGYAEYRWAYWEFPDSKDDVNFRKRCREAIGRLDAADSLRPNQYAVLQNMGLIYLDRRFDADGDQLEIAERLFKRSESLKPTDYFAPEQLALIRLRLAQRVAVDEKAALDHLEQGLASASRAIDLRPRGSGGPLILAELNALKWKLSPRAERARLGEIIEEQLGRARAQRPADPRVLRLRLRWAQWCVVDDPTADAAGAKAKLVEVVKEAEQALSGMPESSSAHDAVMELESARSLLAGSAETRERLRFVL